MLTHWAKVVVNKSYLPLWAYKHANFIISFKEDHVFIPGRQILMLQMHRVPFSIFVWRAKPSYQKAHHSTLKFTSHGTFSLSKLRHFFIQTQRVPFRETEGCEKQGDLTVKPGCKEPLCLSTMSQSCCIRHFKTDFLWHGYQSQTKIKMFLFIVNICHYWKEDRRIKKFHMNMDD